MASKPPKTALAGHTAGIFADMTLDGPEIGTLVAVVDRAKNLPSRKTIGKQDPYCAMRLGKEAKKTETDRRGGQTPKWDQELRFTVHESPDYYRLKCSVFNDDKKTDLIGESWIDLTDLIKPGGGSNDLWHQLNYKGKYAGDVRIELTYYDLRPREEKLPEKKKHREKTASFNHDNTTSRSAQRQLGPRDVQRRPLPSSPSGISPSQTPPTSASQNETPPPPPPPKIPLAQPEDAYVTARTAPETDEQYHAEMYAVVPSGVRHQTQQYRQPFCEEQSPTADLQDEPPWPVAYDDLPEQCYDRQLSSNSINHPHMQQTSIDSMQAWRQIEPPESQYQMVPARSYHQGSYDSPSPPSHSQETPSHSSRFNTSPVKPTRYRDSPLRQSMNHYDVNNGMAMEPDTYDELPPPPPPTHWETTPQSQQVDYPPSSFPVYEQSMIPYGPQRLDMAPRRTSFDSRSPLQHIEYDMETYRKNRAVSEEPVPSPYMHDHPQQHSSPSYSQMTSDEYFNQKRHSSYDAYHDREFGPPEESRNAEHQRRMNAREPQMLSHQDRADSYQEPRSSRLARSVDDYRNSEPRASSQPDLSQLDLIRPQPVHPNKLNAHADQALQRKAIGDGSYSSRDGRRLSASPYGPDAYNVLNPASSPVTNDGTIFQTHEQSRESARMKEVEKLRDQGPIIGNDGRVIDPSDHLPSDTWAPEPERKTRRPEHVIHFRTKNDSRLQNSSKSLPASTNNDSSRHQPAQHHHTPSPKSGPQSSHRNRLQKPAAARPLPAQPYAQPQVETRPEPMNHRNSAVEASRQQAMQRYSYQGSSSDVHRPQLSEYQIPVNSGYMTQDPSTQRMYQTTTTRHQMQTGGDYHSRYSGVYDDPLAAEMSTIDIGPSRGGQVVLSGRRGY